LSVASAIIELSDPRLHEPQPDSPAWQPPIPLDSLELDRDRRAWIEALSAHNPAKATGGATCGKFFRKILEYANHWVRAGRTTCHLATCRNCGRGKMRAHRIYAKNPTAYAWMVDQESRTLRLTISYGTIADSRAAYRQRIDSQKRQLALFRRRLRRDFGPNAGLITSVELDPTLRDVIFRGYYVGPRLGHQWIRDNWRQLIGLSANSESKHHDRDRSKNALRDTLDSLTSVLVLPGAERSAWEQAFDGFHFTSSSGSLRGIKPNAPIEDEYKSEDPAAPYGRCPCGCNGIVEKSEFHNPMTLDELATGYKQLDFGPLSYYTAYRPKATDPMLEIIECVEIGQLKSPFPLFYGRYGPD
jgi:hypothetical protein